MGVKEHITDRERRHLVDEVLGRVWDYPDTHHQAHWYRTEDRYGGTQTKSFAYDMIYYGTDVKEWNECGTVGCLAGHTVAAGLELGLITPDFGTIDDGVPSISYLAAKLLDLTTTERATLFDIQDEDEAVSTFRYIMKSKLNA